MYDASHLAGMKENSACTGGVIQMCYHLVYHDIIISVVASGDAFQLSWHADTVVRKGVSLRLNIFISASVSIGPSFVSAVCT